MQPIERFSFSRSLAGVGWCSREAVKALRLWTRRPYRLTALTITVIVCGVMASATIMFAVANALLLRPLTFPAPDELVTIELFDRKASTTTLTGRAPGRKLFDAWRTAATDKIDLAGFGVGSAAVSRVPSARTVQLVGVTWNMFRVLGLAPTYGRAFDSGDEIQVPLTPIVLSDASWSLLFGRDITAIGRTIDINGRSCIIVGIMPTGYHVPLSISEARQNDPELWMPMAAFVAMDGDGDANYPIEVVGRLRPQRPVVEVTGELQAIATGADTSIASEAPLPKLVPLTDAVSRSVRTPLLLLVAAVGLLLLLGSFNIANLLLTSTLARGRELATRVALGALPAHIALQLAIEVFVLVLAGAGIGVGLAFSALPGLLRLGQWYLPSTRAIAIDWRVLAFSALLSLVAGVGVAIWPAYRAVRQSPMGAMTSRSKSVGRHTRRLMKLLVIGQVAVSVVILANMGVLGRSFSRLLNLDRGYDPHGVVTAAFILPSHRYATVSSRRLFWRALQESLDSRPEINAASVTSGLPVIGGTVASVLAEGRSQAPLRAAVWSISGDYFRCLGIRGLRGDITDLQRIQEAVVIDAAGAQAIFGRDEALGQRVSWGTPRRYGIVVAVVGDIHDMRVNVATNSKSSFAGAHLYIDASDEPPLVVRVAARAVDTRAGLKALDEAIKGVDRDMPLSGLESLEQLVDVQLARERFLFVVAMVIGIVSVGVALAGMFALMTHAATERSHEIGVRLAIGARPSGILIMILQEALGMTSLTLIASVPLLLLSSSALAAVLFETSSLDLTVFGSVVGIILAVTIAASLMPAMRAASINVNEMLRRL